MTRYTPLWEQAGSYAASIDRRLIAAVWPPAAVTGCAVTAQAGTMLVNIAPGAVASPSQNSTGSTLCVSDAVEQVAIAAASGQNRIDLVICRPRGTDLDGGTNNDFIFDTVQGIPAASPAPPAVPVGTVPLAQVLVPTGSVAVTQPNITDIRPAMLNGAAEPATTSASIVTRTDTTGEVWVAKAGVNGGLWRKARDVVAGRWWRAAAYTFSTSNTVLAFDTVERDPYGLYGTASGIFACPVAGWYLVSGKLTLTPTAAGNTPNAIVYKNGAPYGYIAGITTVNASATHLPMAAMLTYCAAGDQLVLEINSIPAVAGGAGQTQAYLNIAYTGTG
jgi:hypothetical protein